MPRHAAGFSPDLKPLALAASNTRSMRPRRRLAVSDLVSQIGARHAKTPVVWTRSIGSCHIGWQCAVSVSRHCQRCFKFLKPLSMLWMNLGPANWPKGWALASLTLASRLAVKGSTPALARAQKTAGSFFSCLLQRKPGISAKAHLPELALPAEKETH